MPTRPRTALGYLRFSVFQIEQDALTVFQKCEAFMGECNFSGGSLQQFHAESGLKCIQTATDDGGRDSLGTGSSR